MSFEEGCAEARRLFDYIRTGVLSAAQIRHLQALAREDRQEELAQALKELPDIAKSLEKHG